MHSDVEQIIQVNTWKIRTANMPDYPLGNVILFEDSLPLACRYIQICPSWTSRPI